MIEIVFSFLSFLHYICSSLNFTKCTCAVCTLIFTFRFGLIKKKTLKNHFSFDIFSFCCVFLSSPYILLYCNKFALVSRCLSGNCNKIDNFILYMRSRSVLTTVINNRFDSINVSTLLDCWWWIFFTSSVSWLYIYQNFQFFFPTAKP